MRAKMKEMVGGCCVCSDERGWAENPLVYCDGHGCNVAVHQACYGIIQVPTGPWFCRKCESQERAARVRCELCPLKDGALKRTDSGGWCHVVCALFIPEAWFANVQTMEPIMLKNVPPDRFNRMCYICEELGKEVSKASTGACMQCNRNGCKLNFHVTCAQANGFLCEESGSYGDNVKYCGYCSHHYKKLKKDSNIKTIPAFKPIPADNATPDSTPEKMNSDIKINISAEHKNRESLAARQLSGLSGPPFDPKGRDYNMSMRSYHHKGQPPQVQTVNKTNTETKSKDKTSDKSSTSSSATETPTSSSSSLTPGTVTEPKPVTETGKLFSPLPEGQVTLPLPVTTHVAFPTSLDGMISSMVNSTTPTPTTDTESMTVGRPRKSRAGSLDKDKKSRRGKASLSARHRAMKSSLSEDNEEVSPPTNKRTRKKSESTPTISVSTSSTIVSVSSIPSTTTATPLGPQNLNVFGGEPHFPNPISRTPFSHTETGTLVSHLPKMETSITEGTSQVSPLLPTGLVGTEKITNGPLVGPPKPFTSSSLLATGSKSSETPGSMEELLERQWEQGSNFLMEQGQHFDIASLLNCLHQLKTENTRLEEYVRNLMSRRDHLLAVNARLSLPFNQNPNPAGVQGDSMDVPGRGEVTPNHLEPKIDNISDDEGSPINVVDTPGDGTCRNSPVVGVGQGGHDAALRNQLFSSQTGVMPQNTNEQLTNSTSTNGSSVKDPTAKDKT
ncbi:protein AF-10-like [Ruditapes philippinarum]|uniref:protein AF-10-like n=2 Tax=Ruditapes philippinarum TaxID=129788 RepID=UPI00295C293C|nr:protein AF-10-like [Ruditapes philippinarum]